MLALSGLFVLMTKHNLEYPHFYSRLYSLLTPSSLNGPQVRASPQISRASPHISCPTTAFSHLLSSCQWCWTSAPHSLTSSSFSSPPPACLRTSWRPSPRCVAHNKGWQEGQVPTVPLYLPLRTYTIAAHASHSTSRAQRLCRLALTASPSAAALALGLTHNMLLQHPAVRALIHRPPNWKIPKAEGEDSDGDGGGDEGDDATAALLLAATSSDPFEADESDPEHCGAINSCLWEVDTLRLHACPTVASIASLFATPITLQTPQVDLEPLGTLTYSALGQLETRKRLRTAPLAMHPPGGLFARPEHTGPGGKYARLGAGLDAWRA